MSQLILAVHPGIHDATAAVLVDYEVKAAVQLERLTRKKSDGGRYPDECIAEVLSIAGASLRDVDALVLSRSDYPVRYFTHFRGWQWVREQFRTHVEGRKERWMPRAGAPPRRRSRARRVASRPGRSAPSTRDAWNTARVRLAPARSSPIRRGAIRTTCSTSGSTGRSSCRLRL